MTAPALAVCVAVTFALAQRPAVVSAPAEHRVELVTTHAVRLIFLEHHGPYWAAGAKFADVRDYMSHHNQSGPMFMLYQRSMRGLPSMPASLIGFIDQRYHIPEPPFRAKTLAARRIVRLMVEGKAASPRLQLRTIDRWAADNGHSPSGEILEIYHLAPDAARRVERTEFQLLLTALPRKAPPDVGKLDEQAPEPESPLVARTRPPTTKPAPPPTPSISVDPRSEAKPSEGRVIDSIPALVRAARYDRVAALVLPDARGIDRNEQIWIGQVILRIKAAGRGLDRKYPKADGATTALAKALLARYRVLFEGRPADLLVGATTASADRAGPRAKQQRAIMRQLDALLSRIAFAAAPDTVADEVAHHLERARSVLEE